MAEEIQRMGKWETDNTGNYSTAEQKAIQRKGEIENGRDTDTGFTAKATNLFIHKERKGVRDRERERHWHRFYCKGHQPYKSREREWETEKGRGTTQVLLQRPPTHSHTRREREWETENGRGTDTGFTAKATNSFTYKERKGVRDRERERHWHRFYCKGHQPYRTEGENGKEGETEKGRDPDAGHQPYDRRDRERRWRRPPTIRQER